jgi:uncharacterized membrane protein
MAKKASAATEKGKDVTDKTQDEASDQAQGAQDSAQDAAGGAGDGSNGIFSELLDTAKDAALDVLKPVIKEAASSAAGYAAKKGPEMIKDKVGDLTDGGGLQDLGLQDLANNALKEGGPLGKIAGSLGMGGNIVGNILPGGDDDDEDGEGGETDADATGSGRRMPVQQAMDVAVPLSVAYNQWTQFEEYPNFMHRVNSASQDEEGYVTFTEKMWNFTRDFKAEIVEQRPDERIVWRSVNGLQHAGVVTFHELAPRLTHIELTVDFKPAGFFEKIGRGARFSKRAIRADMHRFKAYIEMKEEEDGEWRGFVEDGEVTGYEEEQDQEQEEQDPEAEGEEAPEGEYDEEEQPVDEEGEPVDEEEPAEDEEEDEEEEPEAEEEPEEEAEAEEEPEAEAEEEPEAEADEEEEPEAEEEPEEKPAPKRRRQTSKSSGNGRSKQSRQRRSSSSQKSNGGGGRKRPSSPRKPKPARTAAKS